MLCEGMTLKRKAYRECWSFNQGACPNECVTGDIIILELCLPAVHAITERSNEAGDGVVELPLALGYEIRGNV